MADVDRASVEVVHFADPWCWWSWGLEPVLQRLKAIYGDQVQVTYRMGGMAEDISAWRREYDVEEDEALRTWIRDSNSITGSPVDPDSHLKSKVSSSWPACIAVKAAQVQSERSGERFLRKLMEKNLLFGMNGSSEAVYLEAAREVGLDTALVQSDVQEVCGLIPQLWADCIGGAAVEAEYLRAINETGFEDVKILKRLDYFAASESDNTKRLTRTFGADSVVIVGTKPER